MPPKKVPVQVPNKKTVEKKKDKVIEDKTFGIKNKKGKKQQVFIKQVTNQVKFGGAQSVAKREADVYQLKKERADKEKEKNELDAMFKPVNQVQKISAGADPKSVLCIFFKQGLCTKGEKCKFSHDLSLENKTEKRSMYVDSRDDDDLADDTMDKWDTDKLEEVVGKKHATKTLTKTEIVCKHFLQAIEKGLYGWFWECPSGGDKCIYRHALPQGFILKKQRKEHEELLAQDAITLEELVEKEREALSFSGKPQTKVTLESFLAWKKRKLKDKRVKTDNEMAKKKEAFKQGKTLGISGREVFLFNPDLVGGDDDDMEGGAVFQVERETEEDSDENVVNITNDILGAMATHAPEVRTEGQASGLVTSDSPNDDPASRAGASGDEGIDVDEGLFQEDFDLSDDAGDEEEEEGLDECVDVDESLFDVEDLQDLNLEDPS